MFIKYILLPDVSSSAKIEYVVLHPHQQVMAVEVYDNSYEILIVEYTFRPAKAEFGPGQTNKQE